MDAEHLRFEDVLVGEANEHATATMRAVAESPGTLYNPLIIHGPSGAGKSRLLLTLGAEADRTRAGFVTAYRTIDELAKELAANVEAGTPKTTARQLEQVDLLLLDDAHELAGREDVQRLVLHLCEALVDSGRQVVFASRRPPAEWPDVDPALLRRLTRGLVVSVAAPGAAPRRESVQQAAEARNVERASASAAPPQTVGREHAPPRPGSRAAAASHSRVAAPHAPKVDTAGPHAEAGPPPAPTAQRPGAGAPRPRNSEVVPPPVPDRQPVRPAAREREAAQPSVTQPESPPIASRQHESAELPATDRGPLPPGPRAREAAQPSTPERKATPRAAPAPTPPARLTPIAAGVDEYASFLNEVAAAVSQSVEPWRLRLGESVARWSAEGFRTALLERALSASAPPELDPLERWFAAAVARLRALQAEASRIDAALAAHDILRDPERLREAEHAVGRALLAHRPPPAPQAALTIDTLIPGRANQTALRAAAARIDDTAAGRRPLVLHGGPRTGKTHLVHAMGNALAARGAGARFVACVSALDLARDMIDAIQEGALDRWHLRYGALDAVLLDDVQLLGGNPRVQEELLSLLQALRDGGRQIVATANAAPAHLVDLTAALREWFEEGEVVEMGAVPESEREAHATPVPFGAEAAAPTIDAWFNEAVHTTPSANLAAALEALGGIDSFFLDPEKCITDWPGVDGRVVEEVR